MLMKREKAFTVIELPVAAVISQLLSIVLPSLRRVKRQAAGVLNLSVYPHLAIARPSSYGSDRNRHNLYLSGVGVTQ
jgi:type II secretory pathway pseudopilin PulG